MEHNSIKNELEAIKNELHRKNSYPFIARELNDSYNKTNDIREKNKIIELFYELFDEWYNDEHNTFNWEYEPFKSYAKCFEDKKECFFIEYPDATINDFYTEEIKEIEKNTISDTNPNIYFVGFCLNEILEPNILEEINNSQNRKLEFVKGLQGNKTENNEYIPPKLNIKKINEIEIEETILKYNNLIEKYPKLKKNKTIIDTLKSLNQYKLIENELFNCYSNFIVINYKLLIVRLDFVINNSIEPKELIQNEIESIESILIFGECKKTPLFYDYEQINITPKEIKNLYDILIKGLEITFLQNNGDNDYYINGLGFTKALKMYLDFIKNDFSNQINTINWHPKIFSTRHDFELFELLIPKVKDVIADYSFFYRIMFKEKKIHATPTVFANWLDDTYEIDNLIPKVKTLIQCETQAKKDIYETTKILYKTQNNH